MNDIHQKALERAQQRAGAPQADDTAFASERERAKEALRAEMNSFNGQNVTKISAFTQGDTSDRKLRVAAYCRVSTDDEDQVISMELQKKNYRELITGTPNWIYYGTFVDDGYSGTNTEHRRAFQLMMKHAEEGRFDMIITKSVSRFARNLIDCITWVRALQAHDPPIAVFFEQEGINTLNTSSNIILFVLAMVAEEESHMKSEAMLLSLEWRFSRGRFLIPAILGYDKIVEPDGNGGFRKFLRINEDEARTIRLMYYMLVNGEPLTKIAETLTDLQRETGWRKISPKLHNTEWTPGAVRNVLRNQKYCGDILARKTWTPDFHDHKSRPNRGDKNKYYQADHHEAIVSRAILERGTEDPEQQPIQRFRRLSPDARHRSRPSLRLRLHEPRLGGLHAGRLLLRLQRRHGPDRRNAGSGSAERAPARRRIRHGHALRRRGCHAHRPTADQGGDKGQGGADRRGAGRGHPEDQAWIPGRRLRHVLPRQRPRGAIHTEEHRLQLHLHRKAEPLL